MRYLPLTEDDRGAMLARIGAPSVDALFADQLEQPAPLGRSQCARAGRVDHRGQVARHHEHGAAHPQHAHQGAPFVQRLLQVGDLETAHAAPGAQVDADRIAGVQADQTGRCRRHVRRGRGQTVARRQAGAPLRRVDASACGGWGHRAAW